MAPSQSLGAPPRPTPDRVSTLADQPSNHPPPPPPIARVLRVTGSICAGAATGTTTPAHSPQRYLNRRTRPVPPTGRANGSHNKGKQQTGMKPLPRAMFPLTTVSFLCEATTLTPSLHRVSFLYEATSVISFTTKNTKRTK